MSRCCCKTAKHTTADTSVMEHTVPIDTNSFGAQTANTSNMEHRVRNDTNWFGAQTNEKLQRICRCEHCKVECKHANILRNNPVRIGREAFARSGPDDFFILPCFRIGSVWPKPDTVSQNEIRSVLVYYPGRLWKNGTEPETGTASCQKPDPMIPAHWLASMSDVLAKH